MSHSTADLVDHGFVAYVLANVEQHRCCSSEDRNRMPHHPRPNPRHGICSVANLNAGASQADHPFNRMALETRAARLASSSLLLPLAALSSGSGIFVVVVLRRPLKKQKTEKTKKT